MLANPYPWPEGTTLFLVLVGLVVQLAGAWEQSIRGCCCPWSPLSSQQPREEPDAQDKSSAPSPVRGACLQPTASSELQRHAQSRVSHPPDPVAQHPRSRDTVTLSTVPQGDTLRLLGL